MEEHTVIFNSSENIFICNLLPVLQRTDPTNGNLLLTPSWPKLKTWKINDYQYRVLPEVRWHTDAHPWGKSLVYKPWWTGDTSNNTPNSPQIQRRIKEESSQLCLLTVCYQLNEGNEHKVSQHTAPYSISVESRKELESVTVRTIKIITCTCTIPPVPPCQ